MNEMTLVTISEEKNNKGTRFRKIDGDGRCIELFEMARKQEIKKDFHRRAAPHLKKKICDNIIDGFI